MEVERNSHSLTVESTSVVVDVDSVGGPQARRRLRIEVRDRLQDDQGVVVEILQIHFHRVVGIYLHIAGHEVRVGTKPNGLSTNGQRDGSVERTHLAIDPSKPSQMAPRLGLKGRVSPIASRAATVVDNVEVPVLLPGATWFLPAKFEAAIAGGRIDQDDLAPYIDLNATACLALERIAGSTPRTL